ncbi:pyruvate, phosphate dikinase [Rhodococcus sp. C26F]
MTRVVALDHARNLDRAQLGGKGYGLAQMIAAGIEVPPGFVVTTTVSREFDRTATLPDGLPAEIQAAVAGLEASRDRRLGDPAAPLLVSVRSGAPVSMPGMMDTVLNLGMTPQVRDALAERTTPEFAWDVYRRYLESFGTIVLEIPQAEFDAAAERATGDLPLSDLKRTRLTSAAYELVYDGQGYDLPIDPHRALEQAVIAVLRSWSNPRAKAYREMKGISDDLGTAVTVQSMVFGNLDERSATGVLFTRDPNTGEKTPFGDVLFQAQGEDVVSGRFATSPVSDLGARLPEVWESLWDTGARLERMVGDVVDIEFTVESGRLFILQARAGMTTPTARARIQADLAREGIIDAPAVPAEVISTATVRLDPDRPQIELATGIAATPGVASGEICVTAERARERADEGHAVILIRPETSPDDISGMAVACGIVTARGGLVSHAAVTARELAVPTIVGAETVVVTPDGVRFGDTYLSEGDAVTVDADTGRILRGRLIIEPETSGPAANGTEAAAASTNGAAPAANPDSNGSAGGPQAPDVTPLLVLHALRVSGLAGTDRVAAVLLAPAESVTPILAELADEGFVKETKGRLAGWMLTPAGRAHHEERIQVTDPSDRDRLEQADEVFCEINGAFKQVCTEWQMRTVDGEAVPNSHDDADYDGKVLDALTELHSQVCDLTADLTRWLPRFASYEPRLAAALERARSGDVSAVARPMSGSYHDTWMELHEDLIVTLGRVRTARDGG